MNKPMQIFGIIAIVALVAVGAVVLTGKKPVTPSAAPVRSAITATPVAQKPTVAEISPTQPTTGTPAATGGISKYSAETKAKIRSEFIASCKAGIGQQYGAVCNCGADYLAAKYSEAELARIYVEYHATSKIPTEVQAAYDACKNK
jgi:mannitol-specific phosphotransferase system IIBC component